MPKINWTTPNDHKAQQLISALCQTLNEISGDSGESSFSAEAFNSNRDAFALLEEGNKPVACGSLRFVDKETCELKRMFSAQPGNGGTILKALETRAQELGYQRIILSTRRINQGAVSFYQKNGYREIPPYGKYKTAPQSICLGIDFGSDIETVEYKVQPQPKKR